MPSPARQSRHAGNRGFTLIELLIATSLLAVLALLAWRGLDSILLSRQRIVAASDELRSLTLAFAQLDEDLRKTWPVRLLKLQTPPINFTVSGEKATATMELLREATGASEPTQVQRVSWRLRNGVLERGFGVWSVPGAAGAQQTYARNDGATVDGLVWQPILGRVAAFQMQGWINGQGWVAAEALAGQLQASQARPTNPGTPDPSGTSGTAGTPGTPAAPMLVTGLQVKVIRQDGEVLQRIFPVKD